MYLSLSLTFTSPAVTVSSSFCLLSFADGALFIIPAPLSFFLHRSNTRNVHLIREATFLKNDYFDLTLFFFHCWLTSCQRFIAVSWSRKSNKSPSLVIRYAPRAALLVWSHSAKQNSFWLLRLHIHAQTPFCPFHLHFATRNTYKNMLNLTAPDWHWSELNAKAVQTKHRKARLQEFFSPSRMRDHFMLRDKLLWMVSCWRSDRLLHLQYLQFYAFRCFTWVHSYNWMYLTSTPKCLQLWQNCIASLPTQ